VIIAKPMKRQQVMKEAKRNNTQKSYAWVYRGGEIEKKAVVYD